jgi:hypothetical protein
MTVLAFSKAWVRKGKIKKKDAALLAGVTEDQLRTDNAEEVMARMDSVKKGFASWMNHIINTSGLIQVNAGRNQRRKYQRELKKQTL